MLTVSTWDTDGTTQRGITLPVQQLRFSSRYPGGYGYCSFSLPGRRLGWDYADIGYFYRVRVYNGLTEVWDGEIRVIEERTGDTPALNVTAFGYGVVAGDDTYTKVWIDKRLGQWVYENPDIKAVTASYVPEIFQYDLAGRLFLRAEKSRAYANNDVTVLRYELPKDSAGSYPDEDIIMVKFTWETNFASGSWELGFYDRTNLVFCRADPAVATNWVQTATGGPTAATVYTKKHPSWNGGAAGTCKAVEMTFTAKAGQTPGATDEIWAKLTSIEIYTTTGNTYADDIAKDILSTRLDETGIGLSTDQTLINSGSTRALDPGYFTDQDVSCAEALDWICSFGDHNDKEIAWGVWGDKILWLETKPTATVSYHVQPQDAQDVTISGSVEEMLLKSYAIYQPNGAGGTAGRDQAWWQGWRKTADQTATSWASLFDGRFRRRGVRVNFTTDPTTAAYIATLALGDRDRPAMRSQIVLRYPVLDSSFAPVPLAEVRAGKLITIPNLRAREAEAAGGNDLRDSSTVFLVAETEYDAETGTLTITPDGPSETLARYLSWVERDRAR